jgi:hypothetical protein
MTKLSKVLAFIGVLLLTLSTLAAKDFAKEKMVVGACSDKALEIAEAQALISFGASNNAFRPEPEIDLIHQDDDNFTMTFEVRGIPAMNLEGSNCNYKVQMRRSNLGDCWMEKIEQTKCL